ncbi:MAG: cobalamin-binding protein [Candidatus Brocadiaceae bacterium]|nr:cobalamin-binding protein [Candidatus Brocadiaceae bacterium]
MADLAAVAEALIKGDRNTVCSLVQQALDEGVGADQILNEGLVAGMDVVGRKFKANEFYVPEVLIAARAMNAGMELLAPGLAQSGVKSAGIIVLGTVKGDLHDIGKNLVGMMLKGGGFKVIDAGIDVPAERFVELARQNNADIIGLSALLTTTMTQMGAVIEAAREAGLSARIMVGGAPITQEYAEEIGADGYAADAASAVDLARSLIA